MARVGRCLQTNCAINSRLVAAHQEHLSEDLPGPTPEIHSGGSYSGFRRWPLGFAGSLGIQLEVLAVFLVRWVALIFSGKIGCRAFRWIYGVG